MLSEGKDNSTRDEARQKAQAVAMFLVSFDMHLNLNAFGRG